MLKRPQESDYVSAKASREIACQSLAERQARLSAADMVSTDQAATLTGTSRVTVNAWISKGRAIGLRQAKRGFRMPAWQFEPVMWELLPQLTKALDTAEGWAVLGFLETPMGALNGRTPRQAIEQGDGARAIALASHE